MQQRENYKNKTITQHEHNMEIKIITQNQLIEKYRLLRNKQIAINSQQQGVSPLSRKMTQMQMRKRQSTKTQGLSKQPNLIRRRTSQQHQNESPNTIRKRIQNQTIRNNFLNLNPVIYSVKQDDNMRSKSQINNNYFQEQQDYSSNTNDNNNQDSAIKTPQQQIGIKKYFNFDFFSGKVYNVWLFIIKDLEKKTKQRIYKMYKLITKDQYIVPYCQTVSQAKLFFQAQNAYFKVVTDCQNAKQLLKNQPILDKVLEIYIYNPSLVHNDLMIQSFNLKKQSKKIKSIFTQLDHFLLHIQKQISTCQHFIEGDNGEILKANNKYRSQFPTFVKLTGEDKTEITAYRTNLYGCIKLRDMRYRKQVLKQFQDLVKRVYLGDDQEMLNLERYLNNIDHISPVLHQITQQQKHLKILKFYVQETFYYKLTNSLLRTCHSIEEFKPLTIPFSETYQAIKYFYQKTNTSKQTNKLIRNIISQNQTITSETRTKVYRGCPFRNLQQLKQGDFIQILGFVSTSKNKQYVMQNFIDTKLNSCLLIFQIPQRNRLIGEKQKQKQKGLNNLNKYDKYDKQLDHGYVDLSQWQIAPQQFQRQQQVLINAMNVFRVKQIINKNDAQDGIPIVVFEYGIMNELKNKQPLEMTVQEIQVYRNYQYCHKLLKQITDQGDVLFHSQQYSKCITYYQQQLQSEKDKQYQDSSLLIKLANAQYHSGQTDQAFQNVIKFIQTTQNQINQHKISSSVIASSVIEHHQEIVQILQQKQDTIRIKNIIQFQLDQIIDNQQEKYIEIATKLKEKADAQFKQGQFISAQKNYIKAEDILLNKLNSFKNKIYKIQKQIDKSCISVLLQCFLRQRNKSLQTLSDQLQQVQNDMKQFIKLHKVQVYELLLKINSSLINLYQFIGNGLLLNQRVNKGNEYLQVLQNNEENIFSYSTILSNSQMIQAKAVLLNKSSLINHPQEQQLENIQKSYNILQTKIQQLQKKQPMGKQVGDLSLTLGILKYNQYHNNLIKTNKRIQILNPAQDINQPNILQRQGQIQRQPPIIQPMILDRDLLYHGGGQSNSQQRIYHEQTNQNKLYNYKQQQITYQQTKTILQKTTTIYTHNQSQDHPDVLKVRNIIGKLQLQHNQYQEAIIQGKLILSTQKGNQHTQGAKATLLLAKIYLARGQIKNSFNSIEKGCEILRKALVKSCQKQQKTKPKQNYNNSKSILTILQSSEQSPYEALILTSPIYLEIKLWKSKIHNRQTQNDLALITIKQIKLIAKSKINKIDSVGYLADLYQELGNTYALKGQNVKFQKYYTKSIKLRQMQMGFNNLQNAVCYCAMSKYLIYFNDLPSASEYFLKSFKIFSSFPYDHPNAWILFLTKAYISQKMMKHQQQMLQIHSSVKLISKRYSKNHINFIKVKARYASKLMDRRMFGKAVKVFNQLNQIFRVDKSLSNIDQSVQNKRWNQKIQIKSKVKSSLLLSQSIMKASLANDFSLDYLQVVNSDQKRLIRSSNYNNTNYTSKESSSLMNILIDENKTNDNKMLQNTMNSQRQNYNSQRHNNSSTNMNISNMMNISNSVNISNSANMIKLSGNSSSQIKNKQIADQEIEDPILINQIYC